jgi:hypothetical protein
VRGSSLVFVAHNVCRSYRPPGARRPSLTALQTARPPQPAPTSQRRRPRWGAPTRWQRASSTRQPRQAHILIARSRAQPTEPASLVVQNATTFGCAANSRARRSDRTGPAPAPHIQHLAHAHLARKSDDRVPGRGRRAWRRRGHRQVASRAVRRCGRPSRARAISDEAAPALAARDAARGLGRRGNDAWSDAPCEARLVSADGSPGGAHAAVPRLAAGEQRGQRQQRRSGDGHQRDGRKRVRRRCPGPAQREGEQPRARESPNPNQPVRRRRPALVMMGCRRSSVRPR